MDYFMLIMLFIWAVAINIWVIKLSLQIRALQKQNKYDIIIKCFTVSH